MSITNNLKKIKSTLPSQVKLIAVSKTKPLSDILEAYQAGQRDFGENYVQELVDKVSESPLDIRWHFIGHLQSNKVKYIAPFVHLIHGIDSFKLLKEVNKQALKVNKTISCLLQIHIAQEESKFGFNEPEIFEMLHSDEFKSLKNISIKGLMGMASFTSNQTQIKNEFNTIQKLYLKLKQAFPELGISELSIGMSSDYLLALEHGSSMLRIGSSIFGTR